MGCGGRECRAAILGAWRARAAWHHLSSTLPAAGASVMPFTPPQTSIASSFETDGASDLPADVRELAAAINQLPEPQRSAIEPLLSRVLESTKRRRRILTLVQDALGQLRLDMKYLMFDLEATRRERDEYRDQLTDLDN